MLSNNVGLLSNLKRPFQRFLSSTTRTKSSLAAATELKQQNIINSGGGGGGGGEGSTRTTSAVTTSPPSGSRVVKERIASSLKQPPIASSNPDHDYACEPQVLVKRPQGYSFGGGPGAVRDVVKARAAMEMLEGGLLELSHREVGPIHEILVSTQQLIRDLLNVPKNYEILFIQGGAHAQFAAVPLNFGQNPTSVSLVTGSWSAKSSTEQKKFSKVHEIDAKQYINSNSSSQMMEIFGEKLGSVKADYGYLCTNETMQGIQLRNDSILPTGESTPPIVSDSTSDLLSRKMDISKYGVVFASGGKNLGPAGFAVVIVRGDIIDRTVSSFCPSFLSWKEYANSKPIQNLYHTPAMVSIGIARMVLDDLARRGGLDWAEKRTEMLSKELYSEIDSSNGFYENAVPSELRSRVSVVFNIPSNRALESKFLKQAEARGLLQLINHPSVGGMRASLYNAVPTKAVEELLSFMRTFRREHGHH